MFSTILAIAMQVGPNPSIQPVDPIPPELRELRERQKNQSVEVLDRLSDCLERAEKEAPAMMMQTAEWLQTASGIEKAQAHHCRGFTQANLSQWDAAAQSFVAARDAVPAADVKYRARLGAMAGNAYLVAGELLLALPVLDQAKTDAANADFAALGGEVEIDRARTFVAMGDTDNAEQALLAARKLAPLSSRAWLLSAVLARRTDKLDDAATFIAQADRLDADNPEIELEAGVIAILSGDEAKAREYWTAIVTRPGNAQQKSVAHGYLAQLEE